MPYREFVPDPRLRGLVRAYWQSEHGQNEHGQGGREQEHRLLPERSVRLVFAAGSSWQWRGGSDWQPLAPARLEGLTLSSQRVLSLGQTRTLGADLFPWGARQLFGWQAGQPLDLAARFPAEVAQLSALAELGRWPEARQTLEDWLLRLLSERGTETGKGVSAATQLYQALGNARIGTLAEGLNVSQRQLERQFVQEVGVNAKTLARLIRFEEVHNRLWLDPELPLAPLAYELGFADQAHLNREFKALSSLSPRQFAQWTRLRPREGWLLGEGEEEPFSR